METYLEMFVGFLLALFMWFAVYKVARDIGTGLGMLVDWLRDRQEKAGR
jgi:hypothetical protein